MRTGALRAIRAVAALCALAAAAWVASPVEAAPAPSIASVSPASAPMAGGTVATITGAEFVAGATVDFGGAAGTVTNVTDTAITVTTPARAPGEVIITVTNPDGQSATLSGAFRFLGPPPTLTTVAPATGPTTGSTAITLTGTEFASGASVTVGGRAATAVVLVNSTTVTAVTPWGEVGAADVVYTGADGQTVILAGGFTYTQAPPPTVSSLSPSHGTSGGGTLITITGTGFAPGATVRLGGTAATEVSYVSATTLRARTPAGTASQVVAATVTNPDSQGATRANAFTYVTTPAPTVTAVSPATGAQVGGTAVAVTGTNFNEGLTVTFGSVAGSVVSVSPLQVVVFAPAQPSATKVDITVTNTDGKSAKLTGAFTYTKPPTLTKVTPASGSSAGGTQITLTGTNLQAGMKVMVAGIQATEVEVTSASAATAVTPPGLVSLATVTVSNPDGQGASLAASFQYLAPPVVSAVTPVNGPDTGGTTITVTGAGFGEGARVFVGEAEATDVVVVSATQVTAVTPAVATTGTAAFPRVSVVMPGGLASVDEVTFVVTPTSGRITAGAIPKSGFGLIVFSGGTTSMLVATATQGGCADVGRLSFFAADGKGAFVSYLPSAPPFVNAGWEALFAEGIPANQPLVARCA